MQNSTDRNRYLWQLLVAILCLAALPFVAHCLVGCTPAQMQPVRNAADDVAEVASVAKTVSEVADVAADATQASAELAEVAHSCKEQMEAAPPPELLGVHPCTWDVMAAAQRAADAVQKLVDAVDP